MKTHSQKSRGYSLIEALVASSILLIGISAAASLSLAMVTQEEMNERANRAYNHVDNAVRLLQLGVEPATINSQILPPNDVLPDMTIEPHAVNVPGLGTRNRWWIKFGYNTAEATASSNSGRLWTGGLNTTSRKQGFYVYRTEHFLDEELPRVQAVKAAGP